MVLTILGSVYNDWTAVSRLIQELDRQLSFSGRAASIVLINDGSTLEPTASELRSSRVPWSPSRSCTCGAIWDTSAP